MNPYYDYWKSLPKRQRITVAISAAVLALLFLAPLPFLVAIMIAAPELALVVGVVAAVVCAAVRFMGFVFDAEDDCIRKGQRR